MTRKRYANTLESIAEYGPDAFYHGAIANATTTALQKANGTMALSDWQTTLWRSDRRATSPTEASECTAEVHHQAGRSS